MSDTDDTDLLVLIPPDFFSIQSSGSDDSDVNEVNLCQHKHEIERAVVNDLITHVNELESRVYAIESLDSSCSVSSNNGTCVSNGNFSKEKFLSESYLQDTLAMPVTSRYTGSLDSVVHFDNINSGNQRTPVKVRHHFSLPSTPVSKAFTIKEVADNRHLQLAATSSDNNCSRSNAREVLSTSIPNAQDSNTNVNGMNLNSDVSDIKQLCNNNLEINTNKLSSSVAINVSDPSTSCAEQSFGSSYNSKDKMTNVNDTDKFKSDHTIVDECSNNDKKEIKHFEMKEVEKLLKEMEDTQFEIEQKLRSRELHYNVPKSEEVCKVQSHQTGDHISSVPDLGFGVRERFYNYSDRMHPETSGNNDPVIEDICVRKTVVPLGAQEKGSYDSVNFKYVNTTNFPQSRTPVKSEGQNRYSSMSSELSSTKARRKINFSPTKSPTKYIRSQLNADQAENSERYRPTENFNNIKSSDALLNLNYKLDDNDSSEERKADDFDRRELSHLGSLRSKMKYFMANDVQQSRFYPNKMRYGSTAATVPLRPSSNPRSTNLMSLSDLWGNNKSSDASQMHNDPVKLLQKLEEERLKRQHCEQQIHELQKRVLDDQERLAVAVEVDKEKDAAIQKLWNGWHQLSSHWNELEEQRHMLSKQLDEQSKRFSMQADDIKQKVNRWENELSKALDLAAGYKEKCHLIAQERENFKTEMENKMREAMDMLTAIKDENVKFSEEKENLVEKLAKCESESEKDKELVSHYKKKLVEVEHKLSQFEADLCILKEQKENITLRLRDEQARFKTNNEQKMKLQQTVDELKRNEKILKDEVKQATERLEMARVELRTLYQGQLEAVVKEKLREFQTQLNAAEAAMHAEVLSREKDFSEQAAHQCQTLTENHRAEIAALEQRHRTQLKMYHDKMEELEKEKSEAKQRLQFETDRRSEIAQKLHSVMETQWRQALKIISTSSPGSNNLKQNEWRSDHDVRLDLQTFLKGPPQSASSSNNDTAPFNRSDGQNTYRMTASKPEMVDSNVTKDTQIGQQSLKKYIQMLLARSPGNPLPNILDQTTSSVGLDDMNFNDVSSITNDTTQSDSHLTNKNIVTKEREKEPSRLKSSETGMRLNTQSVNRGNKQPWK